MFAVIQTGGKQYLVAEGKKYRFEKLPGNPGDAVAFDRVLLAFEGAGENVRVGTPTITDARVVGKILQQGRAEKITVIKYKAKVRYRRKLGHRQHFTEVEIASVS